MINSDFLVGLVSVAIGLLIGVWIRPKNNNNYTKKIIKKYAACGLCNGRGYISAKPCSNCKGDGFFVQSKKEITNPNA